MKKINYDSVELELRQSKNARLPKLKMWLE